MRSMFKSPRTIFALTFTNTLSNMFLIGILGKSFFSFGHESSSETANRLQLLLDQYRFLISPSVELKLFRLPYLVGVFFYSPRLLEK